jgi:hypothetical protein
VVDDNEIHTLAVNRCGSAATPAPVSAGRPSGPVMPLGRPVSTRLTELAEQARITKQTAGFLVDQLARTGYVRRVPDPSDARARLVRIAERGAAAQPIAAAVVAEVQAAMGGTPRQARVRRAEAHPRAASGDHRPVRLRAVGRSRRHAMARKLRAKR